VNSRGETVGASLVNDVNHCDRVAPWTFGLRDFYANLSARGLLAQAARA